MAFVIVWVSGLLKIQEGEAGKILHTQKKKSQKESVLTNTSVIGVLAHLQSLQKALVEWWSRVVGKAVIVMDADSMALAWWWLCPPLFPRLPVISCLANLPIVFQNGSVYISRIIWVRNWPVADHRWPVFCLLKQTLTWKDLLWPFSLSIVKMKWSMDHNECLLTS